METEQRVISLLNFSPKSTFKYCRAGVQGTGVPVAGHKATLEPVPRHKATLVPWARHKETLVPVPRHTLPHLTTFSREVRVLNTIT